MNSFYHGAYTCNGFKGIRLNSLNPDCYKFVIKGHPTSVKNKLLNKIIDELASKGSTCSVSLNYNNTVSGICCEEKAMIICDGTYPFEEEVLTYGANDGIISLEFFQNKKLVRERSDEILSLNETAKSYERKCRRFIHAAAGLDEDKKHLEKENLDSRKISRYSSKLWAKYGCPPSGKVGLEKKVFFSVPRKDGMSDKNINMGEFCDTAILVSGSSGICGEMIVDRIRRYALSSGADIISAQSFLDPEGTPEHIVIPSLRFGIFSENKGIVPDIPNVKKVRSSRFYLKDFSENSRVRMQFDQRAYESLMKEVFDCIKEIEKANAKLDEIYADATDEDALWNYVRNTCLTM